MNSTKIHYTKEMNQPLGKAMIQYAFSLMAGLFLALGVCWASPVSAADFDKVSPPSLLPGGIPQSFADLAEALSPTVVNIKATKIEKVRGFSIPQFPDGPFGDYFGRFFREMPQIPDQYRAQGTGSGVIISDDGYILTNNHVVEKAEELTVILNNEKEYKARIVGRDPKTDLAVLKIETDGPVQHAIMGDSQHLKVGDWVLAIGNPFGLSHTVTSGIVSAKGRVIGAGPYDDFIQTDASINPGNSGGPLFNMAGELVGINTAIIPQGRGIGFAIPVNTAKPLIPQLVSKGKVSRGYLGVTIQDITSDLAKALELKEEKGALVADVVRDSPADKSGIKRGDIIIAYNDTDVEDSHSLPPMVAATQEGQKATVTLMRKGKKHEIRVKVGELSGESDIGEEAPQPANKKWGLMLEDLKDIDPRMAYQHGIDADHGVVVVGVQPGSPAAAAGVQNGDIILEVNGNKVDSVKEVKEQFAKKDKDDSLLLLVKKRQGSVFVVLKG